VAIDGSFRDQAPGWANNAKGMFLILQGAEDEGFPLPIVDKVVQELRGAKVPFQLEVYSGTGHGFSTPKNKAEERANEQSIASTTRTLKEFRLMTVEPHRVALAGVEAMLRRRATVVPGFLNKAEPQVQILAGGRPHGAMDQRLTVGTSASTVWSCATTAAPSPIAPPTRFADPERTSPTANTPGILDSSGNGRGW
jgi:hypothetical protein